MSVHVSARACIFGNSCAFVVHANVYNLDKAALSNQRSDSGIFACLLAFFSVSPFWGVFRHQFLQEGYL